MFAKVFESVDAIASMAALLRLFCICIVFVFCICICNSAKPTQGAAAFFGVTPSNYTDSF